eukprot:scaffold27486_cov31-Tisochrysis_lutea.AAC.1
MYSVESSILVVCRAAVLSRRRDRCARGAEREESRREKTAERVERTSGLLDFNPLSSGITVSHPLGEVKKRLGLLLPRSFSQPKGIYI